MKAIKTIFAILFVSSMFIACEADTINEEVGLEEEIELLGEEDDTEEVERPE
ncbi:hypothetical protein [Aquimarina sp. 2201CG14-23]|uniref:hypothetical protein n=1 Tax=Aquimarina mycalae TaxID=3040073 RepID=UPI0024781388|nr:hypothetical protein [Aquimarina sp. 2201CG14-23]MDH7444075.1 hypothetical protein [Aquimarina sp. 2201CG14-23]